MTRCQIALGGNLGDVETTFNRAIRRLGESDAVRVVDVSDVFTSAPVGSHAGGEFRNAAASLETGLGPLPLLDLLQAVETELGRTRELHWGPRTLDLDVILYGTEIIDHPRLKVPHPACWYRRFVLDPLAQIAGEVVHPEKGLAIRELQQRLLTRPLPAGICGGTERQRRQLVDDLGARFLAVAIREWLPTTIAENNVPALLFWLGRPGDNGLPFESLPVHSRLDASSAVDPAVFARDVLDSALGESSRKPS